MSKSDDANKIPFRFSVNNCGNDTLVIREITSSCGCLIINKQSDIIMPGASSIIAGEINQSRVDSSNNEEYTVAIRTNQKDTAIHFFKIKVNY